MHSINNVMINNASYSIKSNDKEVYTDGSKYIGKKVGFAAIFTDITKSGVSQKKSQSIQPKLQ